MKTKSLENRIERSTNILNTLKYIENIKESIFNHFRGNAFNEYSDIELSDGSFASLIFKWHSNDVTIQ